MASPKEEFQEFKAQDGNILSPNFPAPVPELSQLTSCALSSRFAYLIPTLSVYFSCQQLHKKNLHNKHRITVTT